MSLFGSFRETRHFAKRATERPGSQTATRRRRVQCEHCMRTTKARRRRCAFCLNMVCATCLPKGADECRDCVDVKQKVAGVSR